MKSNMKIPDNVKHIMTCIDNAGYESYIVGGAVRDHMMGVEPHDYDLFTNCPSEVLLKMFPRSKVLGGEERQAKILTVMVEDVEVSSFRSNGDRTETGTTLEEHQSTCDFTINAMAVDINGKLVDNKYSINGWDDLRNKTLRFVGNPDDRINEDTLRILRGVRFSSKYNMKCETETHNAIIQYMDKLDNLPKERVKEELLKILAIDGCVDNTYFEWFLQSQMPFYGKSRNVEGGSHHAETVAQHMMYSLKSAIKVTDNPLLRLAAFVHDCGKYKTIEEVEIHICPPAHLVASNEVSDEDFIKKETHFYEHEKVGAEIIEDWMREYKFSEKDIKYVSTLVRLHMYSYKDEPSKKSYIKFFAKLKEADIPIMDYVMLLYSDHQGNMKKPRIKFGDFVSGNFLLKHYWELTYTNEPFKVSDLAISGKDLMEKFGFPQGKSIGETLKNIFEKVLDGDLKNERSILLNYVGENLENGN